MRPRSWRRLKNRPPRTRRHCKPPDGSSSAMDETHVEPLTAMHDRGTFDCGKPPLNSFIRQHALANHERGVSRVYVAVRRIDQPVLAYYASSAGAFLRDHLPPDDQAGLPRYPLPTAHLGRLAVDLSCRGQRLGEILLFHFLKTACDVAERIGVFAVDLFSKDDDAKRFYQKYGFIPFRMIPSISICRWRPSGRCSFRRRVRRIPTSRDCARVSRDGLSNNRSCRERPCNGLAVRAA